MKFNLKGISQGRLAPTVDAEVFSMSKLMLEGKRPKGVEIRSLSNPSQEIDMNLTYVDLVPCIYNSEHKRWITLSDGDVVITKPDGSRCTRSTGQFEAYYEPFILSYERYEHHGKDVAVRSDLKGKHREFCLCFVCDKFKLTGDRRDNCGIANLLYGFDRLHSVTTPMWECPIFVKAELK